MVELQILSASVRQVLHRRIALKSLFRSPSTHIKNPSVRMRMLLNLLKKRKKEKRKKMEAIAEDLFKSEKKRQRGVAGTLHGLFARQ